MLHLLKLPIASYPILVSALGILPQLFIFIIQGFSLESFLAIMDVVKSSVVILEFYIMVLFYFSHNI